ncbi:MAG: hypothetical protein HF314_06860 [Ignavibacteria bacterium]|jgi:tRNA1(Val) A37 N6-methylase TrmN6|nr:hypothetical protein [Ignavibacteria bacterium]MCU7502776.1 hypothetical protein [Ignavibacteria bacterium]MCU7518188.1 hypothetical protein [Ignavibacteria bacterium]
MKNSKFYIIALMSVSFISLEIVWTRIFSAEFYYTFAFLILSLSILGLGLGALALRLSGPVFRGKNASGILLLITALLALLGPSVVLNLKLDFSRLFTSGEMIWKFILTVLLLSSTFFSGGIALAKLFRDNVDDMPRLYMSDLIGAGSGALLAIVLMNIFSTPWASFLICLPLIASSFLALEKPYRYANLVPLVLMFVMISYSHSLLNPPRKERAPVIYQHWDAMAKLKVYSYGKEARGINIDNMANTPVQHFDGNWNRPDSMKFDFGLFSLKNFIRKGCNCTVLSLGAGGGGEVLQALQEGAKEIHAVEVNPKINRLLMDGELAQFSGNIYRDSRVKVVTEDGRSYVRKFENKFDLITSFSSNTFAALASGSFALAENYLFTTEAFEDYYKALTEKGIFYMEHQMYMPKVVGEVIDALNRLGVENPQRHIAVYDLPKYHRNLLILSRQPLTKSFIDTAVVKLDKENYPFIRLLYPACDSTRGNLIDKIVCKGWKSEAFRTQIDISPCSDDRPYIAQLGLWRNVDFGKIKEISPYEFRGFPISKLIILTILLIICLLVLPLMLLPYLKKSEKLKMAPWLYFFAIGAAFMIVEVVLIQRYTLFIGASSYSFVVILLTLLLSSGIGSRFSARFNDRIPFYGILALLLLEIVLFRPFTGLLTGLSLMPRVVISMALIAPLGFFMGMPFPKAAQKVGELIDWGFAVNGVASVIGSTAIILITINFGFTVALILGALLYFSAYLLMNKAKNWQ